MYPDISDSEALEAMGEWYQFYLIPGAAHCGRNELQPGPYPGDNMETMIEWVEEGVKPKGLNASVTEGRDEGEVQRLCQWPLRPLWKGNGTAFECVKDEESVESWTYRFDAFKVQPVW
jgi:tannase